MEDSGFWKVVIKAKHGEMNHWCSKVSSAPYGVGLWKGINKLWSTFAQNIHFEVGNGTYIRFWKDKWLGNSTLQVAFPNLFTIVQDPNAVIAAYREGVNWDLKFRRDMHDWEINELLDLYARLQQSNVNSQAVDRLKWGNHGGGIYTVKVGYQQMCSSNPMIDNWPWKLIWRIKLSLKVICYTRKVLYEVCLTQDNLMKRNFQFPNRCYMCQKKAKSTCHLLLHCEVASDIWYMFF